MMAISHSDLMPIRSERSDAGLSQLEIVIGIGQYFCLAGGRFWRNESKAAGSCEPQECIPASAR
jgi:hypothetical protein